MSEPLTGKELAYIKSYTSRDDIIRLLALVDELREALAHTLFRRHQFNTNCSGCENGPRLLARIAPPKEADRD